MIEIIAYEPWHYEYVAGTTPTAVTYGWDTIQLFAVAYSLRGQAYSARENGKIIGCAGFFELWPGVAEAWSMLSPEVKNPFFLHRTALRMKRQFCTDHNIHRMQAFVLEGGETEERWIRRLGFTDKECVLKEFSPDKGDMGLYVWRPSC
jgi:hypothetical protein